MKSMGTVIIDGVEYETETHDFGKVFAEIKIPEGWRLWSKQDILKISILRKEKKANIEDCWFFIEQWKKEYKGKYVAWFYADSGRTGLNCVRNPTVTSAALGVRFCRKYNYHGHRKK